MDVLTLRALLTLDKSQYDRGLDEADSKSSSFGSKFAGKMGKAAKAGALALGAFAVSSIKVGADFDKSMSQVAATMGYTVDELNTEGSKAQKNYKSLEKTARDLGKTTAFSAQEAAEGLNYMALAGYGVKKSQRMLPQVLNLAAAGNMDLASASDMVTDAQSALGLSTKDTETMIDQMAKTSSKTNTSVSQLGSAFLTVGGTAKMMKSDTESAEHATAEMSAALGVLANSGIKGSEGGTALRNVLQGITGSKFDKTFKQLGVEAYDASGQLRDLPDILADMNTAMDGMTTEEKNDIISKTFNVRDLKSVNALLAQTPEKWDELTKSIMESEGAAGNMAETQLDNLSGDVTILKSAFSELQITISDLDHGALRTFVQGATEGINMLTDVLNAGSFNEAVQILGENFNRFGDFVKTGLENAISVAQNQLPNLISTIMNGLANFSSVFRGKVGTFVDLGLNLLKSIAQGVIDNIPTFIQTVPTIIENFAGIVNDNAPKILKVGLQIIKALAQGIIKGIPVLIANIPKILKAMVAVFKAFNWINLGRVVVKGIATGLRAAGGMLKSAISKPINAVKSAIVAGFAAAKEKAVSTFEKMKDGIKKKIEAAKDAVKGVVEKIKGFFPISIGKWLSNLPSLSITTATKTFLGKTITYPTGFSWHAKAMQNPYMFTGATLFGAGEAGDEMLYGKKALMDDITEAVDKSGGKQQNVVYNITVENADSPEEFAQRLVRSLKLEMRTV